MQPSRIKTLPSTSLKVLATIFLMATALWRPAVSTAQEAAYRFDIGASLGMSGYLGDANTSNLYKNPGFAAGASFRYLANTRWAIKGMLTYAGLSGNSADMTNVYPGGETYKFTSKVYDLSGRVEFNFFNYGIGETYRKLKRWSPYLSLGAGLTVASCQGTAVAFNIPMSVGIKYKLRERINLGVEWTMTKAFNDNIDGPVLDDLYQIKSSFMKNTDWYSTMSLTISYEFSKRCAVCNYKD